MLKTKLYIYLSFTRIGFNLCKLRRNEVLGICLIVVVVVVFFLWACGCNCVGDGVKRIVDGDKKKVI